MHSIGKKCLFAFSLEPKFKRKQPKKCQHAKDQFRDKIQTSHESRHAPYCYKRGLCQSLFCLMVGKLSKYSQMSLANRGNGQIDGYPFEDPSWFWSQHIRWGDSTQHLLCCLKVGWSSQSLEVVSVNKIYIWWNTLSYNLTWPEANKKVTYRTVALVKGFWLTSPRANWQQMVLVHINYGRGDCLVLIHWKSTNDCFIKVTRGPLFNIIYRIKKKSNDDSLAKAGFWSFWLLFVD